MKFNRIFAGVFALSILFLVSSAITQDDAQEAALTLDPNTGEGAIELNRKLHCSRVDDKEVTYTWWGQAYARTPGQRDIKIFKLLGMNVRKCGSYTDEVRGTGYRMVSREIMLYLDPETGELLDTWTNPYTNNEVEVIHVANDPVNSRAINYPRTADGTEITFDVDVVNGSYFMAFEVPLFYPDPMGGDYQQHVGGMYHATEIFDFSGNADSLFDASTNIEYANIAWVRIGPWLPWMEMGDRPGFMYYNATGKKLESWDQLPDLMKEQIKENYPEYTNAPPMDDDRPNETSWTYMKKILDARRAEAE